MQAALLMYAIHITVCGILIERVDLPIFGGTLRPASAIVRPWLTAWSTTVALISPDMCLCPWPLCLFLCFASVRILTPLLPLVRWPWSFPGCSSIARMCNSCVVLCLYACQLKGSRDAPSFIHSFIQDLYSSHTQLNRTFELFQRTGL